MSDKVIARFDVSLTEDGIVETSIGVKSTRGTYSYTVKDFFNSKRAYLSGQSLKIALNEANKRCNLVRSSALLKAVQIGINELQIFEGRANKEITERQVFTRDHNLMTSEMIELLEDEHFGTLASMFHAILETHKDWNASCAEKETIERLDKLAFLCNAMSQDVAKQLEESERIKAEKAVQKAVEEIKNENVPL